MTNNDDVVDVIRSKNREIYIKKLNIDLEKILETILITVTNIITLYYVEVNQILDLNEKDKDRKNSPIKDIRAFCKVFKNIIENSIKSSLKKITECTQSIEEVDYSSLLTEEKEMIIKQIEDYYKENIDSLIATIFQKKSGLDNNRVNYYFNNYLFDKLMSRLKENLNSSFQIILNGQHEGLERYENLNNKTIDNVNKTI